MLTGEVAEVAAADVELLAVDGVGEETGLQAAEGARLVRALAGLCAGCLRGARSLAAAHVRIYLRAADVGEGCKTTLPQVGAHH